MSCCSPADSPGFSPAPLSGNSVTGNLGVTGNISASGTIAGSNIPATIPGTGSCTNEFVSALNTAAPPTCSTAPLTALGDIFYESSPTALGRVPGNTTTTKRFLTQTGAGIHS
ncbi:MAG TPA: hypothetical protein VFP59_14020 [Candidatus Angelobacter sp.]|nr:hypothetical protein [Candidatus Angelobacter sp.]